MIEKRYFDWNETKGLVLEIARDIQQSGFKPDYIVGLTRGGLTPATLLSHWFNIPCETLKVSLRDDSSTESNLWMAEDAYDGKNILVVDDINDSGATLNWLKQDWPSGCFPDDPQWNTIWHNNVRFAVLVNNEGSEFKQPDYIGAVVNKLEEDLWIVFPWEDWWLNNRQ